MGVQHSGGGGGDKVVEEGAPLFHCPRHLPRTSTSNIFPEASTSEVRPFIPPDREQNKGDDSEKGDNEEVQSNNESNRDRESEEDKDRPERFIDLDVEVLNDIALGLQH
ncbi:hypothetical protein NPIL_517821 [Nephila pilipes]|uniref:Uncharacterized protein n=1 Tax=Nephila pilipes TaxID=299642 RepID=A0A8X6NUW5_NEPPI|nr:hypothetical protein NPIL_517821 [Nephila pilipes]